MVRQLGVQPLRNLQDFGVSLASQVLEDRGYDVQVIENRSSYGSLLALKNDVWYLIQVEARQRLKTTKEKVSARYKLAKNKKTLYANAESAELRFHAKAHWVAIQVDFGKDSYSVYFGSLKQLVACRSEIVTADAAGGVRVFPLDRASIGGVGVDIAAELVS